MRKKHKVWNCLILLAVSGFLIACVRRIPATIDWSISLGTMLHMVIMCVVMGFVGHLILKRMNRIEEKQDRLLRQK